MNHETIQEMVQERLQNLRSDSGSIGRWREFLAGYRPQLNYPDDAYAWLTCVLALEGVADDNFGVGAILIDAKSGQILAQGHNQVFHPHFRSDRHAEMVVLDTWEEGRPQAPWPGGLALLSSLESCPMCLVRLLCADLCRIQFAAADPSGGMVQRINDLPPAWLQLTHGKTIASAQCAPELSHAAAQIFQINLEQLNNRLRFR
jgi:tRNA(Arg) A34 adenosine deaminase TadA